MEASPQGIRKVLRVSSSTQDPVAWTTSVSIYIVEVKEVSQQGQASQKRSRHCHLMHLGDSKASVVAVTVCHWHVTPPKQQHPGTLACSVHRGDSGRTDLSLDCAPSHIQDQSLPELPRESSWAERVSRPLSSPAWSIQRLWCAHIQPQV